MKDTTPTKGQLRDALVRLVYELGETEHTFCPLGTTLRKAFDHAHELLYPATDRENVSQESQNQTTPAQFPVSKEKP